MGENCLKYNIHLYIAIDRIPLLKQVLWQTEDPDAHIAAFHQGLAVLSETKSIFREILGNYNL